MLRLHGTLRLSALILILFFLLSCGSVHNSDEYFVFVSANIQLPYWKTAGSGFSHAAAEFKGIRFDFTGPQNYDAKAERDALDQARQIVRSNGAVPRAVDVARRYVSQAADTLADLPDGPAVAALRDLGDRLVDSVPA